MILFADTNILLDLYKINLLEDFFRIKKICMEETLFEEELIRPKEIRETLLRFGLNCMQMNDEEFQLAAQVYEANAKLSFCDCIAFAVAKQRGWILLTGDKRLRNYAEKNKVEVHGLLWGIEECMHHGVNFLKLYNSYQMIRNDKKIQIPESELKKIYNGFWLKNPIGPYIIYMNCRNENRPKKIYYKIESEVELLIEVLIFDRQGVC